MKVVTCTEKQLILSTEAMEFLRVENPWDMDCDRTNKDLIRCIEALGKKACVSGEVSIIEVFNKEDFYKYKKMKKERKASFGEIFAAFISGMIAELIIAGLIFLML